MNTNSVTRCFILVLIYSLFNLVQSLSINEGRWGFGGGVKTINNNPKPLPTQELVDGIPSRGLIDYIGNTKKVAEGERWSTNSPLHFQEETKSQKLMTRWNLWRQYPWKKIPGGKFILKARVGGSLPLESTPPSFFLRGPTSFADLEQVDSLTDLMRMFEYGAHDPRVQAVVLEIERLTCGYAKLIELKRSMSYFSSSGKKIYAYTSGGAEKEVFLSLACDEFYIPPDSGLDLRGFSAAATFVRNAFEKIGIEPQVQRIGKYKSFGDTFQRTNISSAQREVISSLLMESSDFWADSVAKRFNKSTAEIMQIWNATQIFNSTDYLNMGFVTGIKYLDQVEAIVRRKYGSAKNMSSPTAAGGGKNGPSFKWKSNDSEAIQFQELLNQRFELQTKDFDLQEEFVNHPRRNSTLLLLNEQSKVSNVNSSSTDNTTSSSSPTLDKHEQRSLKKSLAKFNMIKQRMERSDGRLFPSGLYLRKMAKGGRILAGVPFKETMGGPRIAIINAVGGINTGKSGNSGIQGKTLGSDTLIQQVRAAKFDNNIKGVVLRIDSPGGSSLASDLMWKEIRSLCREKPVVASMVDVAASGGYYIAMACDEIVAEELTVTGSIGVVASKFNAEALNDKLGINSETLSRGRYAEVLTTSRGFTPEEEKYFEDSARLAYEAFTSKAAASRSMDLDSMLNVAQGRVWTGRQANERGLVDHLGGIHQAMKIVTLLANDSISLGKRPLPIQTFREPRSGFGIPFLSGGGGSSNIPASSSLGGVSERALGPLFYCDEAALATDLIGPEHAMPLVFKKLINTLGVEAYIDSFVQQKQRQQQQNGFVQLLASIFEFFTEI